MGLYLSKTPCPSQMASNEKHKLPKVLLEAEGYRIQPHQTVANGGLKRKGTPVAAHSFCGQSLKCCVSGHEISMAPRSIGVEGNCSRVEEGR
jgi:hypothetical protein